MGTTQEDLAEFRAFPHRWHQKQLWRRAAHWMYLRWWVQQDRAHWPAVTKMPR